MSDNDVMRQRQLGDAILIERAVAAVKRNFPETVTADAAVATAVSWFEFAGKSLRKEAERG